MAGCMCAATLSRTGAHVTLVEMGRGLGGRASTRRTRDDPELLIDHGAPKFDVKTAIGKSIVDDLIARGFVEKFDGVHARFSSSNTAPVTTRHSEYRGKGGMDQLAAGIVANAQIEYKFGSMVRSLEPSDTGWRLRGGGDTIIGEYDWLVVSGNALAHSRWTSSFGGEPPLRIAAQLSNDAKLTNVVDAIYNMKAKATSVAMLLVQGESARAWLSLPFSAISILDHPVIEKVHIQHRGAQGDRAALVVHSTAEFAESAKDAFGSTSTAARLGGAAAAAEREQQVLTQIMEALAECVRPIGLAPAALTPAWGPHLHRWGNAFPVGRPLSHSDAFVPSVRLALCGDFVGEEEVSGSIEGALLSGRKAAELVSAELGLAPRL